MGVQACGWNEEANCAIGDNRNRTRFTSCPGLADIVQAAGGRSVSAFLTRSGMVWTTKLKGAQDGQTLGRQIDGLPLITLISVGRNHVLMLDEFQNPWALGGNVYGQLGFGDKAFRTTPQQIPIPNVKKVVCGGYYSVLLDVDNTLWTFGDNEYGQLGFGDEKERSTPSPITDLPTITQLGAGFFHTILLDIDCSMWSCGDNDHGKLGIGNSERQHVFVRVPSFCSSQIKSISVGGSCTLSLDYDGHVWAFGYNARGLLGLGHKSKLETPCQLEGLESIHSIHAGYRHNFAMDESGIVYGWGWNGNGQLGTGDTEEHLTPTQLDHLSARDLLVEQTTKPKNARR